MGIRANATADRLSRTTSLPDARNITAMGWFYVDSDLGGQQMFFELFRSTNYNIALFHEGMRLKIWNGNEVFGTTLSVTTWYHIAVTQSTTAALAYLNGVLDITLGAPVLNATSDKLAFLNNPTGDQHGNHSCAGLKIYDAVLTAGDIKYEMGQLAPRRMSLLYGAWPCRTNTDVTDYSDGGHDLTVEGTLDTVGDPTPPLLLPADGSLRVCIKNRRYVSLDGTTAFALAGGHTWNNIVDISGTGFPPAAFDAVGYLNTLATKGCNFSRFWAQDFSRTNASYHTDDYYAPLPWARTGPGNAADGGLKFDLTTFDATYFSTLRTRIQAAAARGMYCSVMLFEGYMARLGGSTWIRDGHPMASGNNINSISADVNVDGFVEEVYTRTVAAINTIHDAYLAKVLLETYDLWNVVYEIGNEVINSANSVAWQVYLIDQIRLNELARPSPYRHLIWRTPQGGGSTDDSANVLASGADLFSPATGWAGYTGSPTFLIPELTTAAAAWGPRIFDTDHMSSSDVDSVWRAFTRGYHYAYMDDPSGMIGSPPPGFPDDTVRDAMGHVVKRYAPRMALETSVPSSALASTAYCLATPGSRYCVYQPGSAAFTVDLSGYGAKRFKVEWLKTTTGETQAGAAVAGGSAAQSFTPPFSGSPNGITLFLTDGWRFLPVR